MNTTDIQAFNIYNTINDLANHEFEFRQLVYNGLLEYRHVNAGIWLPVMTLFLQSLPTLLTGEGYVLNIDEIREILHQSTL